MTLNVSNLETGIRLRGTDGGGLDHTSLAIDSLGSANTFS
jgi:hypothetical protein